MDEGQVVAAAPVAAAPVAAAPVAAAPVAAAPEGWYRDPCDHTGHTLRRWDGEAWTGTVEAVSEDGASPSPHWKRHPLAFLKHRWFQIWIAATVVGAAALIGYAFTKSDVLFGVTVASSAAGTAIAFGWFVGGRLRLEQVVGWKPVLCVAVVGGVVGFGLAIGLEVAVARLSHNRTLGYLVTGPVEESAKLAVPLLLYATGRYRNPRAGLAIVLASAAGVAMCETVEYEMHVLTTGHDVVDGEGLLLFQRTLAVVLHMTLTGFVGAVAWRAWHACGGFRLTPWVVGATLIAMGLHSGNDLLATPDKGRFGSISFAVVIVSYLLFRAAARELTPPDAVLNVPPSWRPAHLRTGATRSHHQGHKWENPATGSG